MINAALSLFLLSTLVAEAQQTDLLPRSQIVSQSIAFESANNTSQSAGANSNSALPASQEPKPPPPQKKEPPKKEPEEIKRPPIEASMVGYIDNAIVGSQARIRFDAAFHDSHPDRAEFIYAKCGCYRPADPNAPGPGNAVPKYINFQTLSFLGEYAPRPRISAFLEIPIRWVQPQGVIAPSSATQAFSSSGGIGDIQAGVKFAALASPKTYVTAQLKGYFPSGDARSGLGTHHYSLEPSLLYYGKLSERVELEGELGGWLPVGGSTGVATPSPSGFAGNIFFYGIGPSYRVIDREDFKLSPVIELVGWNVTGGKQTGTPVDASGTNIVNLKMGARMSFLTKDSIYIGYGKALTSADWYNQIVRVEYRHAF